MTFSSNFLYCLIMFSVFSWASTSSTSILFSRDRISVSREAMRDMPSRRSFSTFIREVWASRRWPWAAEVLTWAALRRWVVFSEYFVRERWASWEAIWAREVFSVLEEMLDWADFISVRQLVCLETSDSTSSKAEVALLRSLRALEALSTQVFIFWDSRSTRRDSFFSDSRRSLALDISRRTRSGDWTIWAERRLSSACPS
mmetsp:Transcript_13024/g.23869  ORF Transcript_13024/g.23869 Transcript_13024/m.23869 type:complete len:201 (-) Transcript_13024:781-1383(-)